MDSQSRDSSDASREAGKLTVLSSPSVRRGGGDDRHGIPYFHKKIYGGPPVHPEVGHYREMYAGYASDKDIQWAGQSGGVISALLIDLLERKEIGGKEKGKFVFVGVSCQIHAFRKASEFSKTLAQAEGGDNPGQSDIVARTERGSVLIQSAIDRGILITKRMDWTDLVVSTKPSEKKLAISNLKILSPLLGLSIPDYGTTFRPKDARDRRSFTLLHIPTLVSSAFFVIFWKVAHYRWVRAFYDKLPLRYIHPAGGLRRRLTNFRRANMVEIEGCISSETLVSRTPTTSQRTSSSF